MKLQEYEGRVFSISVAADQLAAVINMLNEHCFDNAADEDGKSLDDRWFATQYENMQNVMGAIFAASCGIKDGLMELCQAHIEREGNTEKEAVQHGKETG